MKTADLEILRLSKLLQEGAGKFSEDERTGILRKIRERMEIFGKNPFPSYILYRVDSILDGMLSDPSMRDSFFTSPSDFTRDRKLSLHEIVRFLMTCGSMTIERALFRQFNRKDSVPTESALCQQRAKLKPEGLRYLFHRIVEQVCPPVLRLYRGKYRVLAIDGSDTNIFYDEEKESFVHSRDTGYNQFHVNCIYDVLNQIYCGVLVQPKGKTNEPAAAAEMIRRTKLTEKAIIMADRGLASLNLFETVRRKENAEYLIRVKEDYIKEIKDLELKELDVDISFTIVTRQTKENKEKVRQGEYKYLSGHSKYGKNKKCVAWDYEDGTAVTLRVVRFQLSSGKWETLVTSLPREEFSISDLKDLYNSRYEIEYGFRYLKYAHAMSYYHSRKEDHNEQEIYAGLCAYNICSVIISYASITGQMEQGMELQPVESVDSPSAYRWTEQKDPDHQHGYRINCSMGIYIVLDFIRNGGNVTYDVCERIRRYRIPVRRGRSFRRNPGSHSWIPFSYRAA